MQLSDRVWGKFYIGGENGLFKLESTSSGIDKNKLNSISGDIPYITRTDNNNGIDLFVNDKQNDKYRTDIKNVITIGLDTQTVFYQPHKFYTGQNIQVLSNDNLNHYNAKFICRLLKLQLKKFNWGGNGATLGRLIRTKIMLPINDNGNPDYTFMEQYVKEREAQLIQKYKSFIGKVDKCKGKLRPLNSCEWATFNIDDIFTISSGKRFVSEYMHPGTRPFIGATDSGNGITNYISDTNESLDKNVLGVNYNGNGMVISFYHPYECLFTDDVKRFHLKHHEDNKYVLLFMKTVILQQKEKYNYGYKFNEQRMRKQKIQLPVDNHGNPDYAYMEQYSKNLMLRKYQHYLDYVGV